MRSVRIATMAILALVILLGVSAVVPGVSANLWSVQVGRGAVRHGLSSAGLTPPPREHRRAALWLGRAALVGGDGARAVDILARAAGESPQDGLLRVWLGNAYEAQSQLEKALEEWRRAGAWEELIRYAQTPTRARTWEDALLALEVAGEALPEEVVFTKAQALRGKEDRGAAIALLEDSLAVWPQSTHRQEWLILLGDYLGQEERWAEALVPYRQAIEIANGQYLWMAYIGLGRASYFGGQGIENAVLHVQRAIGLKKSDAQGYATMGDLLVAERRYAEADVWYAQAIEKGTGDRWIIARRVDALIQAGQPRIALDVLGQALPRFPDETHFYYQLSQANKLLGNLDQAIRMGEKSVALARRGNAVAVRVNLAGLYEEAGRLREAIETYEAALRLSDGDEAVQAALRQAKGKSGDMLTGDR